MPKDVEYIKAKYLAMVAGGIKTSHIALGTAEEVGIRPGSLELRSSGKGLMVTVTDVRETTFGDIKTKFTEQQAGALGAKNRASLVAALEEIYRQKIDDHAVFTVVDFDVPSLSKESGKQR